MATAPDQLQPDGRQPDPSAPDPSAQALADGAGEGEEGGEAGETQPSPYDELAQRMGWVPRDQFRGDPNDWKPADEFILAGRDIQRNTAQELKAVREQLDVIGRTSASIVEQQVEQRTKDALDRFNQAIEEGDPKAALAASQEVHSLAGQRNGVGQPTAPSPDATAWAQKNGNWFQKDPLATARAIEICDTLARTGVRDHGTQLKAAEEQVRREFPHLFGKGDGKPQAGVHAPGSRATPPANRQKGFSDMPKAAQDIANDMAARGLIPDKDAYVKNYWTMVERKA